MTDGAGFTGSHIVGRLLTDDFEVMVIDNLSTGRLENVAHHQGKNRGHMRDFIDAQDAVDASMLDPAKKGAVGEVLASPRESLPQ